MLGGMSEELGVTAMKKLFVLQTFEKPKKPIDWDFALNACAHRALDL
jgi:hypothetical protein